MKFSVGYQLCNEEEEPFSEIIAEFHKYIGEVYFASPGMPSGRSRLPDDQSSQRRFEDDLQNIDQLGIDLNLLLNANCYGSLAMSKTLENCIIDEMKRLQSIVNSVKSITTTSPAVATIFKRHFPQVKVRASVNMRIGTIQGMKYLANIFDGYYVQRDYNRNLDYLQKLKNWTDENGKSLHLLANSGCMRFCSGQTFHDNMVAHELDIAAEDNIDNFIPYACWNYFRDKKNWPAILQATWIRPEDIHHYEKLFSIVKLATRLHQRPWAVIRAYTQKSYNGNLLDLLEPGFSPAFAPCVLDNSKFPEDWFSHTSKCNADCESCGYCEKILSKIILKLA